MVTTGQYLSMDKLSGLTVTDFPNDFSDQNTPFTFDSKWKLVDNKLYSNSIALSMYKGNDIRHNEIEELAL